MMKIYSLMSAFLLSTLFSLSFAQLTNETMMVGTTTRSYKQYLPTGFDPQNEQVSLLVILHGIGSSSADMVSIGFNTDIADTARVIAIYPQGIANQFGQTSWNNGTLLGSTADDIGFMNAIVDDMILNYNVDPAHVYFTGFSMGSIMTYHVACAMNNRVAAVGCMSGTMSTTDIQSCSPGYATPVMHVHGTADGTVPYDGSPLPSLSLVPQTIAFWQNVHSCDATADSVRIPDTAADNITIDRFRYDNCDPLASLELWRMNGADHVYVYEPTNDMTEIIEVWRFLRKWEHPSPAPAGLEEEALSHVSISPNPSNGIYAITTETELSYVIRNVNGQAVHSGILKHGENTIELSNQPAGVYFLEAGNGSRKLVKL